MCPPEFLLIEPQPTERINDRKAVWSNVDAWVRSSMSMISWPLRFARQIHWALFAPFKEQDVEHVVCVPRSHLMHTSTH
jgi:hypothetical protein